jgi:ABC-type Na+ efflux pump permease subunit
MRFAFTVLRKELLRLANDRTSLLLWIGMPLVIGGLITLAMGGSGGPKPRAKVLILDRDEGFLSEMLARALSGGGTAQGSASPIDAELVEEQDGLARIEAGKASALLIIPEGFGQALLDETPTRLELITNPAQRILPGIVEGMLDVLSDATFYVHRVFGDEIALMFDDVRESGPTDLEVAALAVRIHHAVEDLDTYLFPPAIDFQIGSDDAEGKEEGEEEKDPVDVASLFFPGIVLMALLFAAQGLSEDIWHERSQGTLRRLRAAPQSTASLLAGKCAASFLALTFVASVVLVIGILYHGLSWSLLPFAALFSGLSGTLLYLLMLALQVIATSQRAGSILSNSIVFPMLMLGGSFFPTEAMPSWMVSFGEWTPNGRAVELLRHWLLDRSTAGVLVTGGFFLLLSLLLFASILPRLRGRFSGVS